MKNYAFTYEDSRMFIKNFSIENDKLVLHLGTGEKYIVDYTEGNVNKVLNMMELQVSRGKKNTTKFKNRKIVFSSLSKLMIIIVIMSSGILANSIFSDSIFANLASLELSSALYGIILPFVGFVTGTVGFIKFSKESKTANDVVVDIEKNSIFLDIREELDKNLGKNPNLMSNLSKKAKSELTAEPSKEVSLQSLDNLSLEDLKMLRANLMRDKEFGFGSESEDVKKMHFTEKNKPMF